MGLVTCTAVATAALYLVASRQRPPLRGGMSLERYVRQISERDDAVQIVSRFDRGALDSMARRICGITIASNDRAEIARRIVSCANTKATLERAERRRHQQTPR